MTSAKKTHKKTPPPYNCTLYVDLPRSRKPTTPTMFSGKVNKSSLKTDGELSYFKDLQTFSKKRVIVFDIFTPILTSFSGSLELQRMTWLDSEIRSFLLLFLM